MQNRITLMPSKRVCLSLDPQTAECLKYMAANQRRSVSNYVHYITWMEFKKWTDHWKPEEVEQLVDSFDYTENAKV